MPNIQASGIITGSTVNDGNSFSTIGNGGFPEDALEEINRASPISQRVARHEARMLQRRPRDPVSHPRVNDGVRAGNRISDLAEGNDAALSSETNATANNDDTLIADHAMSIYGYDRQPPF